MGVDLDGMGMGGKGRRGEMGRWGDEGGEEREDVGTSGMGREIGGPAANSPQIGFLTEWQMYAQKLEGDSWQGEVLDKAKIDKMSGMSLRLSGVGMVANGCYLCRSAIRAVV